MWVSTEALELITSPQDTEGLLYSPYASYTNTSLSMFFFFLYSIHYLFYVYPSEMLKWKDGDLKKKKFCVLSLEL